MSNTLVDVYPYIREDDQLRYLIFRRSNDVLYANQWRMIGGKVKAGEHRVDAARRELKEETGCIPLDFWVVPDVNRFYEAATDTIHHIAAFAARLDSRDSIRLNHEHQSYKRICIEEVRNYLKWPEQIRLMHLIHEILTGDALLPEWKITNETPAGTEMAPKLYQNRG